MTGPRTDSLDCMVSDFLSDPDQLCRAENSREQRAQNAPSIGPVVGPDVFSAQRFGADNINVVLRQAEKVGREILSVHNEPPLAGFVHGKLLRAEVASTIFAAPRLASNEMFQTSVSGGNP